MQINAWFGRGMLASGSNAAPSSVKPFMSNSLCKACCYPLSRRTRHGIVEIISYPFLVFIRGSVRTATFGTIFVKGMRPAGCSLKRHKASDRLRSETLAGRRSSNAPDWIAREYGT